MVLKVVEGLMLALILAVRPLSFFSSPSHSVPSKSPSSSMASSSPRYSSNRSSLRASIMESMNCCIRSVLMPARSYPTDILKMKDGFSNFPLCNTASRRWRIIHAFAYSSQALGRVNSEDHSTLYASSRASMQGLSISKVSMICTVFSSMKRPPTR